MSATGPYHPAAVVDACRMCMYEVWIGCGCASGFAYLGLAAVRGDGDDRSRVRFWASFMCRRCGLDVGMLYDPPAGE